MNGNGLWLVSAMGGNCLSKRAEMVKFFDGIIVNAAIPLSSFSSPDSLYKGSRVLKCTNSCSSGIIGGAMLCFPSRRHKLSAVSGNI